MRFLEHGPDIPDELLVARDEGNVLFFCGAGVSLANAKLADFLTLAKNVIDDLGSLSGSQARRLYDAARPPSGLNPMCRSTGCSVHSTSNSSLGRSGMPWRARSRQSPTPICAPIAR